MERVEGLAEGGRASRWWGSVINSLLMGRVGGLVMERVGGLGDGGA